MAINRSAEAQSRFYSLSPQIVAGKVSTYHYGTIWTGIDRDQRDRLFEWADKVLGRRAIMPYDVAEAMTMETPNVG